MSKTICITGANRGLGLGLAQKYLDNGDQVVAMCRNPDAADELRSIDNDRLHIIPCDVGDAKSISQAFENLPIDKIDILMNNAGVLRGWAGIDSDDQNFENWQETLTINVTGPFLVTKAALPYLEKAAAVSGEAMNILTASQLGSSEHANGFAYSYCASKAAVVNMGLNLAAELRDRKIAIGILHPGWVQTDMGGSNATTTITDSVNGIFEEVANFGLSKTGLFFDFQGNVMKP